MRTGLSSTIRLAWYPLSSNHRGQRPSPRAWQLLSYVYALVYRTRISGELQNTPASRQAMMKLRVAQLGTRQLQQPHGWAQRGRSYWNEERDRE